LLTQARKRERDGAKSNDSKKLGLLYSSCSVLKMMLSPQHFPRMLCCAVHFCQSCMASSPEYESMVLEFASLRDLWIYFMYVLYSTVLHLPPLRFRCVGGCWDRTQRTVATSASWLSDALAMHSGLGHHCETWKYALEAGKSGGHKEMSSIWANQ
jgi:hypothetical protein